MTNNDFEQAMLDFQLTSPEFKDANAKAIETLLTPLVKYNNLRSIAPLLLTLNDDAKDDSGMFLIIHTVENFNDDIYIAEFLNVLPQLWIKAPKWASILLMRSLNNEKTSDVLVHILRNSREDVKQSIKLLSQKINDCNPNFLSKTLRLSLAIR